MTGSLLVIYTKICSDVTSGMLPSWDLLLLSIIVVLLWYAGILMVPKEEEGR